jgi:hypothetical protein
MIEELAQVTEAEEAVAHLVRLIETHHADEAEALAPQYAARWPENRALRHFAYVLGPTRYIEGPKGPSGRDFSRDCAWLKAHARDYPGCYIALREDEVIAIDPDIKRVTELADAARENDSRAILLHYEPPLPQ